MHTKRLYNKLFKYSNNSVAILKYQTIDKWIDSCSFNAFTIEHGINIVIEDKYYTFTMRLLNIEHFIINNIDSIYNYDSLLRRIDYLLSNKTIKLILEN